jgi:O-acetyl-ADP-ribose deacetylase (regulator of RNase III)
MPAATPSDLDSLFVGTLDSWAAPAPILELVVGDITREHTDAIVNPVGPGLVDLAIRRAAGPELLDAFHDRADELPDGRVLPGQAVATAGFRLPAAHVIHCGPPVFHDGAARAREDLIASHVAALRLARANGWASVAFPAIGTGVYGYPAREAAGAAFEAVVDELRRQSGATRVRFVLATPELLRIYSEAAAAVIGDVPRPTEHGVAFADLHGPVAHSA